MFKIKKNEVLPILLIGTTMLIVIIMLNVLLTIIDYVFSQPLIHNHKMRKRITNKVDVNAIGIELQKKTDRRREVFRDALINICTRDNVNFRQAKNTLRMELKWACVKREVGMLGSNAAAALAS